MLLKKTVTCNKQKTKRFLVIRPPTCLKFGSGFCILKKDKKGIIGHI